MDTIRSYIDTMFSRMQPSPEVLKAREELLSMMEDKYNELILEGLSENEAIGQVISEFGNLDELADTLGIRPQVTERNEGPRPRSASLEEANEYLLARKKQGFFTGLAVALFIMSVIPPMALEFTIPIIGEAFAPALMFIIVAIGVIIIIYATNTNGRIKKLFKDPFALSYDALGMVNEKKESQETKNILILALGIGMCVISIVPPIIFSFFSDNILFESIGGAGMFLFCGIGVWMIIYASFLRGSFSMLLKESRGDFKVSHGHTNEKKNYENKTAATIMSVYWPTVTCFYLSISFLSFAWTSTWIIWVIAAIAHMIIDNILKKA